MRKYFKHGNAMLTVALIALVTSRSVDQALSYRLARKYQNYIWYLATVVLPVAYLFIGWPVVWYKLLFTKDITPEMKRFPHYKFAIMAFFDMIFNLTSSWPVPYLQGTIINVLSNVTLPMTMAGSILFLKTRYKGAHYLGAVLVIYGIMVQLLPQLFLHENDSDNGQNKNAGLWIPVLILSGIPAAASNVYKEIGLKDSQCDVWYMNVWIGVYQLLLGLLTVPTVAIPFPAPAPIIKMSDLPEYCTQANQCFFGINNNPGDDCEGVLYVFLVYIVFNIAYNQLMLYIFKKGSSVLFTIASALRLPLVDVLLLSKFIAGGAAVNALTVFDGYALFILVIGILVYYSQKEVRMESADGAKDGKFKETDNLLHSPHGGYAHLHNIQKPELQADSPRSESSPAV